MDDKSVTLPPKQAKGLFINCSNFEQYITERYILQGRHLKIPAKINFCPYFFSRNLSAKGLSHTAFYMI